jgi:DNA processing protein
MARTVFDGLPARRYARPDEVAARSGVSALDVIRALPALDEAGLVERDGSGLRISARVRAMTRPG